VSPSVALRPMTETEYAELMDRLVTGYAASHVEAGQWAATEARQKAAAEMDQLLPDGVATKDMALMTAEAEGRPVGRLWLAFGRPRPDEGWIYYIEVEPAERGRGFGRAVLSAAEAECAARGLVTLGLNVFGPNTAARSLYESAGYETTSLQMRKGISA
jgi:ribosomal protein S18 acetylase RimI-like enzyme